jgi:glycosyltransferase involved in cell wall biosynthesis
MTPPILSILTPAVPSRLDQLAALTATLAEQIGDRPVEHLVLLDNKRRTVGEKRDALLRAARGKYVAFCDDDDAVSSDYIACLLTAAASDPDVITFLQDCTVEGQKGIVEFRLGASNEAFRPNSAGVTRRAAWHVCAWRRTLAVLSAFPPLNYGEDWAFASPLNHIPDLREVHIPKVLHYYRHSAATTEAPAP